MPNGTHDGVVLWSVGTSGRRLRVHSVWPMNLILRFGAVFGIVSGVLLGLPGGIEAFTGETLVTSILIGLTPVLAMPLLTALYVSHWGRSERPGGVGYAVNLIGLGLFGCTAYGLNVILFPLGPDVTLASPSRIVILAGAVVYVVGTVWFAVCMLRARVHPKAPIILYMVAMPLFPIAAQLPDSPLTAGLHVAAAVALIWLAASLRSQITREGERSESV